MSVKIKFLGAAGTVTGSKYLVTSGDTSVLVDAGLFQGKREWRERNWHTPEAKLSDVDAVLLTHAHIDHTGILPRFHSLGLDAPVYCTQSTKDLAEILLPDSAHLQEEVARWRNKKKKSRHNPALPLYTTKDAESVLKLFRGVPFEKKIDVAKNVSATWSRMGHILGAAAITLAIGGKKITFSGDIGRYTVPILRDPEPVEFGDLLLVESTYGNREHQERDPKGRLGEIISETLKERGVVVIPSFAVGRAQLLLYYIRELKEEGVIPDVPVIVDSPMAKNATGTYRDNPDDYDEEALGLKNKGTGPFSPSKLFFTKTRDESKKLNTVTDPMIIISASGMLSGGRILHHLKNRISSPKTTVIFVGYQPPGGRGDWILSGAKTMKLLGEELEVRARIESVSGLSAHGDRDELLKWCKDSKGKPGKVAVVHGEPEVASDFAKTLKKEFEWDVVVPKYLEEIEI